MKKKILAFIFGLCLLIPCMFIFSACGDNPPEDDPTKWKTVTEATCTTEGLKKRTIDGNEETEKIPALGHNYGAWTITLNETCTTNGSKQQTCDRCNDIKTETILAHHTLDGTILFDDTEHWEHCTKCTDRVNAEDHTIISNKNDNYLMFDAVKYIGCSQVDTCEYCDIQIQTEQKITSSAGTLDFGILYRDMNFIVKDCPVEFKNNFKFGQSDSSSDYFLGDNINYDITYNSADNSITYICDEEDPILGGLTYMGFKVQFNAEGELQSIYRIDYNGIIEETPVINYIKEINNDYITYKLMIVASGLCYRTIKVDNNGNVLQLTTYSYSGTTLQSENVYTYTYDEYGYVSKYETNTSQNPIYEFKNCIYDANGNRVGYDYFYNGNLQYSVVATFNANNQITQIVYSYENGIYDNITLDYIYVDNKVNHITYTCVYASNTNDNVKDYDCLYTENTFTLIDANNSENTFTLTWTNVNSNNI